MFVVGLREIIYKWYFKINVLYIRVGILYSWGYDILDSMIVKNDCEEGCI